MARYALWPARLTWASLHIFIYAVILTKTTNHDVDPPLILFASLTVATYLALQLLDPGFLSRDKDRSSLPSYLDQDRICETCSRRQPLRTKHWQDS